eukprot:2408246-Pleurochrysis_carterae.AAC.1
MRLRRTNSAAPVSTAMPACALLKMSLPSTRPPPSSIAWHGRPNRATRCDSSLEASVARRA